MYVERSTVERPDLRVLDTSLMVIIFTTLRSHFISHSLYTRCGVLVQQLGHTVMFILNLM
jgi:hypothetical protein